MYGPAVVKGLCQERLHLAFPLKGPDDLSFSLKITSFQTVAFFLKRRKAPVLELRSGSEYGEGAFFEPGDVCYLCVESVAHSPGFVFSILGQKPL